MRPNGLIGRMGGRTAPRTNRPLAAERVNTVRCPRAGSPEPPEEQPLDLSLHAGRTPSEQERPPPLVG